MFDVEHPASLDAEETPHEEETHGSHDGAVAFGLICDLTTGSATTTDER